MDPPETAQARHLVTTGRGMIAALLALGVVYWLLRERDDRAAMAEGRAEGEPGET